MELDQFLEKYKKNYDLWKRAKEKDIAKKDMMELILKYLHEAPTDTTITIFFRELTDGIEENDKIFEVLIKEICDDKSISKSIRFRALYTLYTFARRRQNYIYIGERLLEYQHEFSGEPLLNIIHSTYHKFKGEDGDLFDMEEALRYAKYAIKDERINKVAGVRIHFAEIVCIAHEKGIEIDDETMQLATESIDKELSERPNYGKYYYVNARLHAINKEYQKAFYNIALAIAKEDKNGIFASLRIPIYIGFKVELRQRINIEKLLDEEINEFNDEIEGLKCVTRKLTNELDSSRMKIIEYITFFSGIIAFIVSTVQISLNISSFGGFVGLIIVMGSMLILTFSSFLLISHGLKSKGKTFSIVFIIVLIVLSFGILTGSGILGI